MQDDLPPIPLPPLPEMKPIPSAAHEPADRYLPQARSIAQPAFPLGRRLRQMLGMLAGGGFVMTAGLGVLQVIAQPQWKPSTLVANVEAGVERAIFNQKMGQTSGNTPLTEADYRQQLAKAERKGQAEAELAFQKQLAVVQADKERMVQAYSTLYQRANMIAQGAVQLEGQAQQFRQQLLMQSSNVRSSVIQIKDVGCAIGIPEACQSARNDRDTLIKESDELSQADVGKRVTELMQGIDDPATVAVQRDQERAPTFGTTPQP